MQSVEMKNAQVCGKCGAKLFASTPRLQRGSTAGKPQRLCSACLFETGLSILTESVSADDPVAGGVDPGPTCSADPAELLGKFDDYELLEEIGRGGQGIVYRAHQKSLDRTVALKVIGLGPAHVGTAKARLKRFRLEAKAAASLNHPFIVPIHEIGEGDSCCYFSMGLVEGGQLDQVIKRESVPVRRAAELIAKLARTVHYAHEHGILHRDIKPGNILLDAKGEPHLTDFGLARLTETESDITRTVEVLGTPSYMAPEQAQANNGQVTSATDVYGLGAVLYHLLAGHPPFAGGTTYETTRLLLETEPRQPRLWNPKVDRDLSTICLKCLEKDPKRRYPSALALAEDVERWLKREPIEARHTGVVIRANKWMRRQPLAAALIASLVALAAAVGVIVWNSDAVGHQPTSGIAVLPFENLSNDREDASFADGVQDDLLTKLANIADLKVISRTSVMQYRPAGAGRNMREIGKALGVSHVLEGSVRKTGGWLHINAQLIDTRTDSHVWAKQYDGGLKDLFAIQSEIAQEVAEQLYVKVSSAEKADIERPPTADLTAFDLYSRAKNLALDWKYRTNRQGNLLQAADLLTQAVAHDPTFFQAYCQLAWVHDHLYHARYDRTPARLALADAAINAAFRLRPGAGEAHVVRAAHLYHGYLDYDGALAELDVARLTLPNEARIFELKGYIERRRPGGNQQAALRNLERAIELDPRNVLLLDQIATSYDFLRRYAQEETVLHRALAVEPNDVDARVALAFVKFDWKADTLPLHKLIDELRAKDPAEIQDLADRWLTYALAERDSAAAANALVALGKRTFGYDVVRFSSQFMEGLIARMANDNKKSRSAFTAARAEQEKIVHAEPNDAPALAVLGLIDAALERKEEALHEGRRAVELLPVEKDAINGRELIAYLAVIAAWVGDNDLACEQLANAIQPPSSLSYGQLKLLPFWDPLRGDPRFEKIVASLAPKDQHE